MDETWRCPGSSLKARLLKDDGWFRKRVRIFGVDIYNIYIIICIVTAF